MEIRTSIVIAMGHRLKDYTGLCQTLHGHNWVVDASVTGLLDAATGMIMDFAEFKKIVKIILMPFDHSLMLEEGDPLINALYAFNQRVFVLNRPPTTENIAQLFYNALSHGAYVHSLELNSLTVHETANNVVTVYAQDNSVMLEK